MHDVTSRHERFGPRCCTILRTRSTVRAKELAKKSFAPTCSDRNGQFTIYEALSGSSVPGDRVCGRTPRVWSSELSVSAVSQFYFGETATIPDTDIMF